MECAAEGVWGAAGAVCVVSSAFCGSCLVSLVVFAKIALGWGMEGWVGLGFYVWDCMGWGYTYCWGEIDVHGLLYRMDEV